MKPLSSKEHNLYIS